MPTVGGDAFFLKELDFGKTGGEEVDGTLLLEEKVGNNMVGKKEGLSLRG